MINRIYYFLKPVIPRALQLALRRTVIRGNLPKYSNVWPIDEGASAPPPKWKGWPEGKQFALVLTHDVETQRGHDRCRDLAALEAEAGFRSSFNFVPERYTVSADLRNSLVSKGFEVGVHGLKHDGKYFNSRRIFLERAERINGYLKAWGAVGYRSPSMLHNLEWFHDLDIEYDASTFDTDPFEPQSDGVGTIFPFFVPASNSARGFVELPYTLAQDFTLFILMRHRDIRIWKRKLDWVVERGGMVLLNSHPDYMNFGNGPAGIEEYPAGLYGDLLRYVAATYKDAFWHVLPKDLASWFFSTISPQQDNPCSVPPSGSGDTAG